LACLFLYDKIRVSLYVADPNYIDAALHPYSWYKRFVIDGAGQHRLSREYVDTIPWCRTRKILTRQETGAIVRLPVKTTLRSWFSWGFDALEWRTRLGFVDLAIWLGRGLRHFRRI